ncbi:hypothetical protein PtA15_10A124 [Puccinia triticina]|uniref:Uncharacterized protein n=1 Tax=Puccinia triticina TaxID=208348 RepID=A0ABY7CUN9_9BASI|nr:uncharacterized protein PtA15_10A124 [Puccinia triticina]WAQ88705.1 hypothetical protein PtA15_10A124 [Puccinia triticina]
MQTTVYWSVQQSPKEKSSKTKAGRTGCPIKNHFRIDLKCPRGGVHIPVPNSRKQHTLSRKCGCQSKFSIFHDVQSNSLRGLAGRRYRPWQIAQKLLLCAAAGSSWKPEISSLTGFDILLQPE